MKILYLVVSLICIQLSVDAQQYPIGKWQYENISADKSVITRYVFHFKSDKTLIWESIKRSEKYKSTYRIVYLGRWNMIDSPPPLSERNQLANFDPIFKEYYNIDGLESLRMIEMNLLSVQLSTTYYDNGKIRQSDATDFEPRKLTEFLPYQSNPKIMTLVSRVDGKMNKMVYFKIE